MKLLLLLLGMLVTTAARAQDVALTCLLERVTDEKAHREAVTGEVSFILHITTTDKVFGQSSKCAGLKGTATEIDINVGCGFDMDGKFMSYDFIIDGVGGKLQEFYKYGTGGLVYDGHCTIKKPLF